MADIALPSGRGAISRGVSARASYLGCGCHRPIGRAGLLHARASQEIRHDPAPVLPTVNPPGRRGGSRSTRRSGSEGPNRRTQPPPPPTPATARTRNPSVTTVEKNRGIFGSPGEFCALSGTKLSVGARSSTRTGRHGPHHARPDQTRPTPRITTPSSHRTTSTTARDPRPAACPADPAHRIHHFTEPGSTRGNRRTPTRSAHACVDVAARPAPRAARPGPPAPRP
jgi:hypothetical protein